MRLWYFCKSQRADLFLRNNEMCKTYTAGLYLISDETSHNISRIIEDAKNVRIPHSASNFDTRNSDSVIRNP